MDLSDLIRTLLAKRGITEDVDIAAFLAPDYIAHTHAPELLEGMGIATTRLLNAIEKGERIAIYADFDCDGIPGAGVLSDFFAKIKYDNVEVYLPHRDREGYGFHQDAIAQLAARDVKLIITVDVGTTAVESVRFAREKGVDVIVTDHHEITGPLPEAIAVLNPKRVPPASSNVERYPFAHLCGAAVAFKLVQATLTAGRACGIERFLAVAEGWEKWLLDLVAIATIADMVPLTAENRALSYYGLMVLRKSPRPGIAALCTKLRLKRSELTEDDIGFAIAPRINAASRMDEPLLALRLLVTEDRAEAELLAAQLEKLNASRKGVVGSIVREARKRMQGRYSDTQRVVVIGDPEWKPALLGLAANSLLNDRARLPAGRQGGMVCLWGRDGNGRLKGSCRSDGALSVVDVFAGAGAAFLEYGGHAASGGFSVSHEQVHTLAESMEKAAQALEQAATAPERTHDALVTLREIAWPLYRDISRLAPFGVGNPKPVFRLSNTKVSGVKRFGKEQNHVEVSLACEGSSARGFDFFRAPQDFTFTPVPGGSATILATVERDSFRGGLALRIVDVLPAL